MAINEPRLYLICYDISDPRRLSRVHRYLTAQATPIQYSVFMTYTREARIREVLSGLEERIDVREDDVRVYPLPRSPKVIGMGRAYFPKGIMLVEQGKDLLWAGEAA